MECADLAVPLDWDDPDSANAQELSIAIARLPATGDRLGTIVVNPGGPGASGVDYLLSGFRFDEATSANYDIASFDPRGVGSSTRVSCVLDRTVGPLPDYSPDDASELEALLTAAAEISQRCQGSDEALLPYLGTHQVAADLNHLRLALGEQRLNYLGLSYGSYLGAVYAAAYPESVGRFVLDGIVFPGDDLDGLLTAQAEGFENAFVRLNQACDDGALACPQGGALTAYRQLEGELEAATVGQVGPTELAMAALFTLYNERLWPALIDALTEGLDGNFASIEALSDRFLGFANTTSYLATLCADSQEPTVETWEDLVDRLEERSPDFGAVIANEVRACATWPERAEPGVGLGTDLSFPEDLPPLLIIGNTGDAATPLHNAERLADLLPNAGLLVVDRQAHTAYSPGGCVGEIVQEFFASGVVPDSRAVC